MNARELIERKKRGGRLSHSEISALVQGYASGAVPDYQMAALLMAVWFKGLDRDETLALTDAMMRSGRVLDLTDIDGPKIDKHSTGGIGDKVSLPLVGIAMASGLRVPMLSGRGLGHTGGTLDKLEAIPGYQTRFDEGRLRKLLDSVGGTIIGQSDDLVPADGGLYALRDVTATVDCNPLIVASILSKKFAAGVQGVVLDVKVGSGAFMRDMHAAQMLATHLLEVGTAFGKRVRVLFTRMDEPLGRAVGNAIEVEESVATLRGGGPEDLVEVTLALAAEMIELGGLEAGNRQARALAAQQLESGKALDCFRRMVEAQGGRLDWDRDDCGLEIAPHRVAVEAPRTAVLQAVDGYEVGMAVVDLGGGRQRKEDQIDHAVGLRWQARIGDRLQRGQPVVHVHARPGVDVGGIVARLEGALSWSDVDLPRPPLLLGRLEADG